MLNQMLLICSLHHILHDDTILVVLFPALARRHLHRLASVNRRLDHGQALLRPLIARVRRPDVPHVGLENVLPAANAHFQKVPHGILSLDVS